jgi:hypothetical protein
MHISDCTISLGPHQDITSSADLIVKCFCVCCLCSGHFHGPAIPADSGTPFVAIRSSNTFWTLPMLVHKGYQPNVTASKQQLDICAFALK